MKGETSVDGPSEIGDTQATCVPNPYCSRPHNHELHPYFWTNVQYLVPPLVVVALNPCREYLSVAT